MLPLEIDPRILGKRLAEARKAREKTQEEIAVALGCSRPTYIAMEKGERLPKPDHIIQLAQLLGRTVNDLVRPGEPVTDLQPHLRAAADKVKAADQNAMSSVIDDLQRLAEDYAELERMMNAPLQPNYPPEIRLNSRLDPAEQAEVAARQERNRLGLGDQPVIYLRRALEWDVGLRIFYRDLPSSIAGMYAYSTDLGGCVLVNHKHPEERRRVTMLHEYGHLLVDRFKPGIDYLTMPGRKPANERFAEAFSLCFLMPAESVRRRFQDILSSTGDFQVADLCRLRHYYFVSLEAMTLRLEQLGLIPKGTLRLLKDAKFKPKEAESILQLPSQAIDDAKVPERYKYLAVRAFEQEKISQGRLARLLRCDPVEARRIVQECLMGEIEDEDGQPRGFRLDLPRSLLSETS